jgi:hypothetical protein
LFLFDLKTTATKVKVRHEECNGYIVLKRTQPNPPQSGRPYAVCMFYPIFLSAQNAKTLKSVKFPLYIENLEFASRNVAVN